jgi:hypothetical protein
VCGGWLSASAALAAKTRRKLSGDRRQTWTLDGETNVVITNLIVELNSRKVRRLQFRKPDGVVKDFALREFMSRAEYVDG